MSQKIKKTKRKIGERALILIDEIDLMILLIGNGYSIMRLVKKSKIQHKSLKPHINRLEKRGLLVLFKIKKSNIKLINITNKGNQLTNLLK